VGVDPPAPSGGGDRPAAAQLDRTLIDPARRRKPKDKPRVERPMQYIRDSFWLGREFASLEQIQAQAQALHWCREVAGRRKARPLDGRAPIEVFEQQEVGTLIPLPREPFAPATRSRAKVGNDITSRWARASILCPGACSTRRSTCAPRTGSCRSTTMVTWSRHMCAPTGAG
jgi:hypothetical protein